MKSLSNLFNTLNLPLSHPPILRVMQFSLPSRHAALLTLILSLTLSSPTLAESTFNGYLKTYTYADLNTHNYTDIGTRTQTLYQAWPNSRTHIFAALNYDLHQPDSLSTRLDIYPVEFYANLTWDNADLKIGRQFIFWGKAAWVNPTDVLNPWDYSRLSGEVEDYRTPVLALNGQVYWSQLTLQALLLPVFDPVTQPMPGVTHENPVSTPDHSQFGLRLLSYFGQTDLSLSLYHGFEQQASVIFKGMNMDLLIPQPLLIARHQRMTMIGADLARTFGPNALKMEAAYFLTEDRNGDNIYLQNPHFDWVIGLDRSFSDKFSTTLQFSQVLNFKYDRDSDAAALNAAGMSSFVQAAPTSASSLSAVLKAEPLPFTTAQLVHVYNLADGDHFSLAFLSYELMDAVRLTLGSILFNGPPLSPFGRSRDADKLFAELKVNF